jgi:hypothetical protein
LFSVCDPETSLAERCINHNGNVFSHFQATDVPLSKKPEMRRKATLPKTERRHLFPAVSMG